MKTKICLALTSALSILAGSAFAQTAPDAATAASGAAPGAASAAASAAPAEPAAPASPIPPPPEGKGQIVFYRPWNYMGAADWIKIRENGQELGKLYGNWYFVQVADPGPHSYTVAMETTDTLKMEVDPGETYYVEARVGMGVMLYRFSLAPVDGARFIKAFPHMKLSPPPKPAQTAASTQ
jgi:hypothetical protein